MKSKKDAAAEFHRNRIAEAAETLFLEKGFEKTTIDDISRLSEYSRRTVYAYFESKEEILNRIAEKGLCGLKSDIAAAVSGNTDFNIRYKKICSAMKNYILNCPVSSKCVSESNAKDFDFESMSDTAKNIILLGTEINELLARFLEDGKACGAVHAGVFTVPSVYVLWSGISGLVELVKTKGIFLEKSLGMTEEEFLEYGFEQIRRSLI